MQTNANLEDILWIKNIAEKVVLFLTLQDKRNLRLVNHAGKHAVDKTVTVVRNSGRLYAYGYHLARSNWKDVTKIEYIPSSALEQLFSKVPGIIQIAEGGFSKLNSLTTEIDDDAIGYPSAQKFIDAGWKLKELDVRRANKEWFGAIMRNANWPLERLSIHRCNDDIAALISESNWNLKHLDLTLGDLTPEGVEVLMRGSWVSTIETLELSEIDIGEMGARAIANASHRAVHLRELNLSRAELTNEEASLLANGSYPSLKTLNLEYIYLTSSALAAMLRKCPMLECSSVQDLLDGVLDDLDDARTIGIHMQRYKTLDFTDFHMTEQGARELLKWINWPTVEEVVFNWDEYDESFGYYGEVIAAIAQHDCPRLRKIDICQLHVDDEVYRMFLEKELPGLEHLKMMTEPGLLLQSKNLPRLKRLDLDGIDVVEAISHVAKQPWSNLEHLSFEGCHGPDGPFVMPIELFHAITNADMPSLRVLRLSKYGISDLHIKEITRWATENKDQLTVELCEHT